MQLPLAQYTGTLTERIVSAIRAAVQARQLAAGSKLPSIRQFASLHGVSTFTVVEAYDRLVAEGILLARRGDGFFISPRQGQRQPVAPRQPQKSIDAFWLIDNRFNPADGDSQPGCGWLPADWYDADGLQRSLRSLARSGAPTGYGDSMGWLPLRQWLAQWLQECGQPARPDNTLLTEGASQALQLIIRVLVRPGDTVLVDDPGYCNLITLLDMAGARVIGVPWTAQGPDCQQLARLMATHRPGAFFTNPRLHNPSGASYDHATTHRVLQLAEQHACWIVEDDVSAALASGGPGPLQALGGTERVIHVGSLSKTLAPTLRVGYVVAADTVIDALLNHKMVSGLSSSQLSEQLALGMLTDSGYRRRLQKLQQRLLAANLATRERLEHLGWQLFAAPAPSLFLWARPPRELDPLALTEQALAQDILLAPGILFRPQRESTPWLRLNVAYLSEAVFDFLATASQPLP
ncbi:PLP-dependent aminotransferase family protein [Vogesella oryzae]|uniref:aminotransferase-like domain-containing protein n=1 Tax=Vogesella oryzae TaxID=1735285 RepID=UPI001582BDC8|nr:PLP-dependent aminotransferase family protein [Vogesella oryzae]